MLHGDIVGVPDLESALVSPQNNPVSVQEEGRDLFLEPGAPDQLPVERVEVDDVVVRGRARLALLAGR